MKMQWSVNKRRNLVVDSYNIKKKLVGSVMAKGSIRNTTTDTCFSLVSLHQCSGVGPDKNLNTTKTFWGQQPTPLRAFLIHIPPFGVYVLN